MHRLELLLTLAIVILGVFIIVYLRLYFFTKQRIEVARFSQRVMAFGIDFAMLNALALVYMFYKLIPDNFSSYLRQGGLQELFEGSKGVWSDYIAQMIEYGGWYLWSDLRIVESVLIGVCLVYTIVLEIFRSNGSFGRGNAELLLAKDFSGSKLSFLSIVARNLVKFTPLILATYWMGIRGVIIYMIILYCIYKINKNGKLPHDFISKSIVLRKDFLV